MKKNTVVSVSNEPQSRAVGHVVKKIPMCSHNARQVNTTVHSPLEHLDLACEPGPSCAQKWYEQHDKMYKLRCVKDVSSLRNYKKDLERQQMKAATDQIKGMQEHMVVLKEQKQITEEQREFIKEQRQAVEDNKQASQKHVEEQNRLTHQHIQMMKEGRELIVLMKNKMQFDISHNK